MPILFAGNKNSDFDVSLLTDRTTTGSFDPNFVSSAMGPEPASGQSPTAEQYFPFGPELNSLWFHMRYAVSSGNGTNYSTANGIQVGDDGGNWLFQVLRSGTITNSNVQCRLYSSSSVYENGPTFVFSAGVTTIDFHYSFTETHHSVDMYLDGLLHTSITTTRPDVNRYPWRLRLAPGSLGYNNGSNYRTMSEIIISTENTIGQRLLALPPISNGDVTEMAGDYTGLLEPNDLNGLIASAPDQKFTWNPKAYTGAPKGIAGIVHHMLAQREMGFPSRLKSLIRLGGVNYEFPTSVEVGAQTSFRQIWDTNPATDARWHTSDLAGIQFGAKAEL